MPKETVWSVEALTLGEWQQIGWSEYKAHAFEIFSAAIRVSPDQTVRMRDPQGKVVARHAPPREK
jgi:hypothetical protein